MIESPSIPSTAPWRVLVVDDNPAIHRDFSRILKSGGTSGGGRLDSLAADLIGGGEALVPNDGVDLSLSVKVEFAQQGYEAVEMARAELERGTPFGMAFVDMRMPPGWDGLTTIEHLWNVDGQLQVVICSASSDNS
jgi:CheY-like chemotaxis protein